MIELLSGVKWMFIVALLLAFLVWFLLSKAVNIYSGGGNPVAAKAAGINIAFITVSCFIIESCLVGLGGVFIFTIISYGLTYISLNPNWQLVIKGLIIIAAVAMDMRKHAASN